MGVKLKVGARPSRLSVIQTQDALRRMASLFADIGFELMTLDTVGDRDLKMDLRLSPGDFFTRELDEALRDGRIDLAIHSAKDLPEAIAADLDWFWLPWREDPRDAWVLPPGKRLEDLPSSPVVGISSERRELYCRRRFPRAVIKPIRGSIPKRLEQLDRGEYDAVLMAGAALNRLELADRVTEWIPLSDLKVPDGQGVLAVTFRKGDPVMTRLRSCFVKAVRFVGAGVGSADFCTWGGIGDLQKADICLYDILMDSSLLKFIPSSCQPVFVGKRCGGHAMKQEEITALLADYARRGLRVVRLKGGDPGLFGRLAEEVAHLESLQIPYQVRAGVSALTVATTGTGLLLTRRGESRGFSVMTPRAQGGEVAGVAESIRGKMPLVLFMSIRVSARMARQLMDEGWDAHTPVAVVFNAGADDEQIIRSDLQKMGEGSLASIPTDAPGLLVIGSPASHGFKRNLGALQGKRVLLTCSEALRDKAVTAVTDLGGKPIFRPMIRLVPEEDASHRIAALQEYDWVVLTSPSAASIFLGELRRGGVDLRRCPEIMVCGPGTASVLQSGGLCPALLPESDYSAAGLAEAIGKSGLHFSGKRVLRLRSEKAGSLLASVLKEAGAQVDDLVLYRNERIPYGTLPHFDAVFFASASSVESFVSQFTLSALSGKRIVALGKPTTAALEQAGTRPDAVASSATVHSAILSLAIHDLALSFDNEEQ